ncbi:hypothetical protein JV173_05175 [Acholeplasma equirhinis]|uniref:hypothetical protein n=1 Tax=Acholeplasma equirhinis TaxID=555393 RepID=UPI00197B04F4|nr:hypothetical protein [Acholeplasma equirhinis]MBN3490905.1 hypothetical protein [Acholeplasma equirhinis]
MDQSKKNSLRLTALTLALISFVFMMTLDYFKINVILFGSFSFNFMEIAFGGTVKVMGEDRQVFTASVVNIIAVVFSGLSVLSLIYTVLNKNYREDRGTAKFTIVFLVVAAFIVMFSENFIVKANPDANYNISTEGAVVLTFLTLLGSAFCMLLVHMSEKA